MYKILVVIFFLIGVNSSYAQQYYTWDEYGISFSLADDFKEVVNNIEEFSAVGDGMEMSIIPFADETVSTDDITVYTMAVAASLNLDKFDDINTIQLNGFEGGYAEGVIQGEKIFLMGLIDPKSDVNFFVIITFLDNDQNAIEEAIEICRSFQKI
ncbi:MAG: hypothetical protein IPL63_00555 [Saprospiraceae bacterium]|jgi:hypothetical protein|nr:hypothetical protein [Saprospiraceae bacterium]MBK6565173.1 hypothetical protein [Saprospiraceae bacterium]MBK6785915.1 hypothetical protein [Saprospiraceae bacterium]MBK7523719.1 hypothetical protein [Saprospiraceae bacterium]MBK8080316.1 hypothetical protein [Saprospiraceae bacterium]